MSAVVFEGYYVCMWTGILCGICRVEVYMKFSYATFKLMDEKGECV